MNLQVNLAGRYTASLFSCYAPILAALQADKECFYEQVDRAVQAEPHKVKVLVLGDFNARVGKDYNLWHKVLGRHGLGKENSNGTMLLDLCVKHGLVVSHQHRLSASKQVQSQLDAPTV